MLIVDTGVILAAADGADPHHHRCAELLETETGPLVTTPLVVAEACYLIDRQLGPDAEAVFFQSIVDGDIRIEGLRTDDYQRVADLIVRYRDLPLGGTDSSVVAVAERLKARRVATLDIRHFRVVRPTHVEYFELTP